MQSLLESKDVIQGESCNPNSRARMQSGESHAVVTREQGRPPGRVLQSSLASKGVLRGESPPCQCPVRQCPLETYVPMGGDWTGDRAEADAYSRTRIAPQKRAA